MGDYIDREALLKFPIRKNHCDKEHANEHFINGIETVLEYADDAPAADVAPVVRCKECKYSYAGLNGLCCAYGVFVDSNVPEDFYCANGERRGGGRDG